MKNTRIGNDINVAWKILKNGNPFSLMGKKVAVYLKTPFGKEAIKDFSVTGNIINYTFYGKDQKHLGRYGLELVVNENEYGMITTDVCNFVNLVACSCKVGGNDEGNVETESIELTSTLEYVAGEGGGSYDDSAIWIEISRLDEEKANKTEIPTKLSQLEQDIEIGGESYDDTEIKNTILELDRTKANTSDVANTLKSYPTKVEVAEGYQPKGNYATESELTELSSQVGRVSDAVADKVNAEFVNNAIANAVTNELNTEV